MYSASDLLVFWFLGGVVLITYGIARKFNLKLHVMVLLLYVSVIIILSDALFPINFTMPLALYGETTWLVPFEHSRILASANGLMAVVLKVLQFVPIGILVPVLAKHFNTFSRTIGLGLLCYGVIEALRLLITFIVGFRYTEFVTEEPILFTAGVVLGFTALKLFVPLLGSFVDVDHLRWKKHLDVQ